MSDIPYTDYKPMRRWTEDPRPLVYIVVDFKADGGDPRINALRVLAAVAISEKGQRLGSFAVNLSPAMGTTPDPVTTQFLAEQPDAVRALSTAAQRPADAIAAFERFVLNQAGLPVLVAAQLSSAALWLDHALRRQGNHVLVHTPAKGQRFFAGGGIDLPSLVMGVTNRTYRESLPHLLPTEWRAGRNETHDPRQDVEMLAAILISMLAIRARSAPMGA